MKTHFFKIIIIILFSIIILNNAELKADNIEGKNWNNPSDTWSGFLGLIPKGDTEKRVAALPVSLVGGNTITVTSSFDTKGLATYTQLENLNSLVQNIEDTLGFVEYDSGYFFYSTVGSDSKPTQFIVTSKVKVYTGGTYRIEFYYYNGNYPAVGDDRDNQIYSIAYIKP